MATINGTVDGGIEVADDDPLDRRDPVEDATDPLSEGPKEAEPAAVVSSDQAEVPEAPPTYRPHIGTLGPVPSPEPETTAFLEPVPVAAPAQEISGPPKAPREPRNAGRVVRMLALAAAIIAAGFGVVTLTGSQTGGPSAPSHPNGPNRVAIAAAERVLGEARVSIARGDSQSALTLLDRADTLIGDVRDPSQERRLRAEVDRLRALAVEAPPTSATSTTVTTRQARVLPSTTAVPVTSGPATPPPLVTTTTSSTRTRPGLPTLLPSVLPTFR